MYRINSRRWLTTLWIAACLTPAAPRAAEAALLAIQGTFDFSTPTGDSIAVDPSGQFLYIGEGIGGSGLMRVNVANPASMTSAPLSGGGAGVAVDLSNGRYATTNAFGGMVSVFNSNTSPFGSAAITGIGGAIAAGSQQNFGINTQGIDRFQIYSEVSNSIVFSTPNAVGSRVLFNSATGNFYAGRGNGTCLVVNQNTFASTLLGAVSVQAVNGVANRVYGAVGAGVLVLDGNTNATLLTVPVAGYSGPFAADTLLNHLYVPIAGGNQINVFDGTGDAFNNLGAFTLPAGYSIYNLDIAPGTSTLYALAHKAGAPNRLFVLRPVPEASTLSLLVIGGSLALVGGRIAARGRGRGAGK